MNFKSFEELRDFISKYGYGSLGESKRETLVIPGVTRLPLTPRRGFFREVAVIKVPEGKQTLEEILWDCLFGTPRVSHWFLLFEALNRLTTLKGPEPYVFSIMMLINVPSPGGGGLNIFNMKLKSVRTLFGAEVANILKSELRLKGINVPKRKPNLRIEISKEREKFRLPPEIRRIGVGYKDKGTLGLPGSGYDPSETPKMRSDPFCLWNELLTFYKKFKIQYKIET